MPWDIDYALLMFTQLKKSKYHLPKDVNVTIETTLNLSEYIFNWEDSKLPKEFFIEKYNTISILLKDYNHIKKIYDGDQKYGHLDSQKECISPEVDHYIGICPDIYFSEYALTYLIESAKIITNKYFCITPQISKVGDPDWDKITNPKYDEDAEILVDKYRYKLDLIDEGWLTYITKKINGKDLKNLYLP